MARGLFLLHSDLVQSSRDLLTIWQAADPIPGDVVTDHAAAVALMPQFCGYPAVVYESADGQRHCLFNPANLAVVTAWREGIDNPPAQTRYTQAEFMRLFTQEEFDALLAAESTDADVKRMWAFIRAVGYADMEDPLVVKSLAILLAKNYITDERLQEIKAGVAQM